MNTTVTNILLLVFFIGLIYFMMIRPQRKKDKEDKAMREALNVGDEVMTIGGVIGKVTKITEKTVVIATGDGRVKIEFVKTAISTVTKPNAEAAKRAAAKKAAEEEAEAKAPIRDKKVTPKKLTKKTEEVAEEAQEVAAETETDAE